MKNSNTDILKSFNDAHARLYRRLESRLSFHGISPTEYWVLWHLDKAEQGLRQIDLAEKLNLTASAVTRLLAPMSKIGLTQKDRNARDARVTMVQATEAGRRIFKESSVTVSDLCSDSFDDLSDRNKQTFLDTLSSLVPVRGR